MSTVAQPHHPRKGADSYLAREPVYKLHVGPQFFVDVSVFFPTDKKPNPQKREEFINQFARDM